MGNWLFSSRKDAGRYIYCQCISSRRQQGSLNHTNVLGKELAKICSPLTVTPKSGSAICCHEIKNTQLFPMSSYALALWFTLIRSKGSSLNLFQHSSKRWSLKTWFARVDVEEQPAQSPDLNPTKHHLHTRPLSHTSVSDPLWPNDCKSLQPKLQNLVKKKPSQKGGQLNINVHGFGIRFYFNIQVSTYFLSYTISGWKYIQW